MDKSAYLKIQRPSNECLMCGANLIEAHKHPSAIQPEGEDGVVRKDYCLKCWSRLEGEDFFSFWIATREPKPERTRISREERNQLLQAYFEHISAAEEQDAEAGHEQRRFFLAHLLMRFRVLRWKQTDRQAGLIVFENVQTAEEWTVKQVNLDDEAVARIKQEIEECLRKGQDIEIGF